MLNRLLPWLSPLLGSLILAVVAPSAAAAERVILSYGLLEFAVSVDSLEAYAREGKVNPDFAPYVGRLSEENLQLLQDALVTPVDLSHVALANFLYSSLGESMLRDIGAVIQTDSRLNGFSALRGALILAADQPEGLTLLNVLQQFPTSIVRLNSVSALQRLGAITQLIEQTNQAVSLVEQQAMVEATTAPVLQIDHSLNPQQSGLLSWQVSTLLLEDRSRDRSVLVDLYVPTVPLAVEMPVVVISHGFIANRVDFRELAEHLASHGIVVAALEHPGSNDQRLETFLGGNINELVEPREFVDRPADVTLLLDELQRLNESEGDYTGQFNLQQVGMIGHSFGGYTALALGGAQVDRAYLQDACASRDIEPNRANLSALLQCLAAELPEGATTQYRDERVQAIFAINPIGSEVFGPQGLAQLNIPLLVVSGSQDAVAPAMLEQLRPFAWISSDQKYLALIEGGTHVYVDPLPVDDATAAVRNILNNEDPPLSRHYLNVMGLAFIQTHVAQGSAYEAYLTAHYIQQSLSQDPLLLHLIQDLPDDLDAKFLPLDN